MIRPTQVSDERAPEIGDAISHYRIIGIVGDGGLGRVYVAEQSDIRDVSNVVALCCIQSQLAREPQFHSLFVDAANVATHVEHPNVVSIYEMRALDGRYFFSMEYVCGENVDSILTRCNTGAHIPLELAASIVKHAANAVQYLHDFRTAAAKPQTIATVEVNPANLFVTYHGTVKLLDSGLEALPVHGAATSGARRVDARVKHFDATSGAANGVAERRTEVSKLGLLLWTCLTGKGPAREGETRESEPPMSGLMPPSSIRAEIPEELDGIVMRALATDPQQTFQSAGDLSRALEKFLLRRDSRPTHEHLRRWMEQLFGEERAALQLSLAQGRERDGALELLGQRPRSAGPTLPAQPKIGARPRELWSTSDSVFSGLTRTSIASPRLIEPGPNSVSQERLPISAIVLRPSRTPPGTPMVSIAEPVPVVRKPSAFMIGTALAVCSAAAIGVAVLLTTSDDSSPFQDASRQPQLSPYNGQLEVRSSPAGAAVFVDGEPTGMRTPVLLKGLSGGRAIRLRVDKAGFISQERLVEMSGEAMDAQVFELSAASGVVRFEGVPPEARVYVDEARIVVTEGAPVSLSVGRHALRVESGGSLIFSGTVDVVAGEQTIDVEGARTAP